MEEEIKVDEDISKEIEKSIPKQEEPVTKEIAEKEEKISKGVSEIPITKDKLEERKEKIIKFLKQKRDYIFYLILVFIGFIGIFIRTRNISKLKDITTGTWTLGPDLDPFLFLRWAKYIVEHGKLFILDKMRSIPLADICEGSQCLAVSTAGESRLVPYFIVLFHKFLAFFNGGISVTYSAILLPVVMFGLTTIVFFLFARKVFYKKDKRTRNIIALISTAFFVLIPSIIPRTIAGIPEKESIAFFFIFLSFYLFLEAFTSEKLKRGLIFGGLAGVMTALLGLTWGGVIYVFITIAASVLLAFLLGKIDMKRFYIYCLWIISFVIVLLPLAKRYTIGVLVTSLSTGLAFMTLIVIIIDLLIYKKNIFGIKNKIKIKLPERLISLLITLIIIAILTSIIFGASFIPNQISAIISQTIKPATNRFAITVAENKQPYFTSDWKGNFGPIVFNIPLYFWLFFIGSIALFSQLIRSLNKKERIILVFGYLLFLTGLIFSKYSPSGILNGNTGLSITVYVGGVLFFLGSFVYFYYKRYKEEKLSIFKEFDFAYLLYFIIFVITLIGAKGAIRLIMVLGAVSPIAVGFLAVMVTEKYFKEKEKTKKFFIGVAVLVIFFACIFTLWNYYKTDKATASNFAPGAYEWQWQKAMSWVRENTSENAVFAHWWDYGYWLQSIGERATILDGGNAVGYWNHLMGRHVLTGEDERTALEFLYAHNGTHLLIDSTDIGKYTAFSSIGSNGDYDKFSWISAFIMDESQTQETNNMTLYIYGGGISTDEDIIWEENGKEILIPRKSAAVGAIVLKKTNEEDGSFLQPDAIFVYNGKQYVIPLRYLYVNNELKDFNSGLDAGVFIFPKLDSSSEGLKVNEIGAALYLSPRTIHTRLAQLYLMDQDSEYIKLVHTESSIVVDDLRNQGLYVGEFIYYQGIQGPIKIWEITYPSDIKLNPDFLSTEYPIELTTAKPGEYSN